MDFPSQVPLFLNDNFSPKQRDDQFILDGAFSSKGTNNFLQDFPPIENFNLNVPLSTSNNNPMFSSLESTCFYPFDNNSPSSCVPNFDVYESKPYGNHGALVPFMDNLSQNGSIGGLRHSNMMITPINMVSPSGQTHHPLSYRDFGLMKSYMAPDEGSSSSPKTTGVNIGSKGLISMVKKGGRGRKKKPNVVKGQWTIEEDRLLIQLVERHGIRKWSQIAQMLNGRIGKQCRERWHNHLRPDIKKDIWSEEEDRILITAHEEIGNKWAEIAKKLPGRTENSIKNHWNATKRRQLSRRKCRSKYPRQSSLLQDYIKTLTPEKINAGCRKKPKNYPNPSTIITIKNPNPNPNPNPPNEVIGSSGSSLSYRLGPDFDFSEVPDFNFDAQMFEESSIDSLLDPMPSEELGSATGCYGDDQLFEGKRELDLVQMINQVNL